MKNIKAEKSLTGPEWWKSTLTVRVRGDQNAADLPEGLNQEDKEKIIQSWETIAVLEVEPKDVSFYVGFKSDSYLAILKHPLEILDGKFGMRIGRGDVEFFAIDKDLNKEVQLKLIEKTAEDNPKYQNLPLY